MTRAEPGSVNDIVLRGGPLLIPLVVSTSAALYRGAMKAKTNEGTKTFDFRKTFEALPTGMWVGIGAVWAYWTASQAGIFN